MPGGRPPIPPEATIDWPHVANVAQAKAAFAKHISAQRDREGVISAYIMDLEGRLFACSNNMKWISDVQKATVAP